MLGAIRPASAPAVAFSVYILTLVACGSPSPERPSPTSQQFDTLTATVRRVGESGLEVITGVQLALKLYYLHVNENTRVSLPARTSTLDDLQPGQVVRIRYHVRGDRKIAEVIEIIDVPRKGGEP